MADASLWVLLASSESMRSSGSLVESCAPYLNGTMKSTARSEQAQGFSAQRAAAPYQADDILIDPDGRRRKEFAGQRGAGRALCRANRATARKHGASIMLIYGAHLLRNGAADSVER